MSECSSSSSYFVPKLLPKAATAPNSISLSSISDIDQLLDKMPIRHENLKKIHLTFFDSLNTEQNTILEIFKDSQLIILLRLFSVYIFLSFKESEVESRRQQFTF